MNTTGRLFGLVVFGCGAACGDQMGSAEESADAVSITTPFAKAVAEKVATLPASEATQGDKGRLNWTVSYRVIEYDRAEIYAIVPAPKAALNHPACNRTNDDDGYGWTAQNESVVANLVDPKKYGATADNHFHCLEGSGGATFVNGTVFALEDDPRTGVIVAKIRHRPPTSGED